MKSSGDEKRYKKLKEIATTVGAPKESENFLASTVDQLTMIGTALGLSEKAKELQKELDDSFTKVADAHAGWKGKSVSVAARASEGWGASIEGDPRLEFLERLGFEQSAATKKLADAAGAGTSPSISPEQLDTLDADLVVAFPIYIKTKEITGDAQWKKIPAVADGRDVVVDGELNGAFSAGTTLATQYALEGLPDKIADAIGE